MPAFLDNTNPLLFDIASLHTATFSSDTTVEDSAARAPNQCVCDVKKFPSHLSLQGEKETHRN